jgi:hypothetical protein
VVRFHALSRSTFTNPMCTNTQPHKKNNSQTTTKEKIRFFFSLSSHLYILPPFSTTTLLSPRVQKIDPTLYKLTLLPAESHHLHAPPSCPICKEKHVWCV